MTLLEFVDKHPVFTIIFVIVVGLALHDLVRAFRGLTGTDDEDGG